MSEYTPPIASEANFNFISFYTPSSTDLYIGIGAELKQVWSDDIYVYAATTDGLDIYDIESEEKCAYLFFNTGFTTVWGNDDRLFLGTLSSGVKYIEKTSISGSILDPYNLFVYLNDFENYPDITSDGIKYLHGYNDIVLIVTESGVDVVRYITVPTYHKFTTVTGGGKCFMTQSGKFYYTINDGGIWSLNRMNTCVVDWSVPDVTYTTGSGIFDEGLSINDIFVTENTSSTQTDNVIFAATSSGVYIIDEELQLYKIYYIE